MCVVCVCVCIYVACTWHVFIVWALRLSSLVLLGCTALMRANSPKHPSGCLQFVQMGERMEEGGRWDVCRRRPGRGKMGCM